MSILTLLIYCLSFVTMVTIGVFILLKNWKSPINRTFFAFSVIVVVWMVSLFAGYFHVPDDLETALKFFRVTHGVSLFPLLTLAFFFYYFPSQKHQLPRWVFTSDIIISCILAILAFFTPLVLESIYMQGEVQMDTFGPLYNIFVIHYFIHFIAAFVFAIQKLIETRGIERRKISYVSLGFFLFTFCAMTTNVILPLWNIFIFQEESVSFSLFFFIGVFYSIYKQRFFNLTFITLNFFRHFLLLGVFLSTIFIAYNLIPFLLPSLPVLPLALISSMIGFGSYLVAHKFFPDLYSSNYRKFKNVLAEFESKIFDCKRYEDLIDILQHVFVEKLNFKNARLSLIDTEKGAEAGIPLYEENRFTRFLYTIKDVLVKDELALKEKDELNEYLLKAMTDLGAQYCFPLFSEGKLVGFFTLGSINKKTLSQEEIQVLVHMKGHLQITFMNILITNFLREENDLMKEIVHEQTKNLKENNQKLEQMIRQQDNFISLTAHEFRTPLTVALLGLEQIPMIYGQKLPHGVVKDINTSHNQLNKLTNLINRLLEMRRLEDHKIPVVLEKINILPFIKNLTNQFKPLAQKQGTKLLFSGPTNTKSLLMMTDTIKLQQILNNLIHNALKFTPKDGKITVEVNINKEKKVLLIAVRDTGSGIPEKDLGVIFEKFQQGSLYSRGVGIGLYLCRQYVELLKGVIKVESKLGEGSTFTIELPLK